MVVVDAANFQKMVVSFHSSVAVAVVLVVALLLVREVVKTY